MVSGLSGTSSRLFHDSRVFSQPGQPTAAALAYAEAHPDEAVPTEEAAPVPEENEALISELKASDRKVRSHEAAHMAAGGSHIQGGASYSYQAGPDGKQYAIGGEVGIDMSPVPGNPRATITKMMMIRAAALAPADPSAQDLAVAAAAAEIEANARVQLTKIESGATDAPQQAAARRYASPIRLAGTKMNAAA